jgi:hypothetical protein
MMLNALVHVCNYVHTTTMSNNFLARVQMRTETYIKQCPLKNVEYIEQIRKAVLYGTYTAKRLDIESY